MKRRALYSLIYLMTVFDVYMTSIGMKAGIIQEGNPIINYFMRISMPATMIGVLIIVALCLYFIYKVETRSSWIYSAMICIAGIKVFICALHLRWLVFYAMSYKLV